MSTNKLKLNPVKTEFLPIGNERQRSKYLSMFAIELLGVKVNPVKSARNLGVMFDTNFTFRSHISGVCNSCFYHMQDLRRIRRHLDLDSAKLLATALVSSRLDYCNSLLYGIADIDLTRLQCVQNQLARLVTKSPPFTHSIPLLPSLHWLPVRFRILVKINLLTYKTLREKQPVYLYSILAASISSRSLRSNNENSLLVPRVKTNTGARAFHSCAPSLWNNLPLSVRSASSVATFKKYLKTHPFDLAFPHRYRHFPRPVDVTELFPRFCRWTLIWLSRHWAWLRRGYWRYRSLLNWLIDWFTMKVREMEWSGIKRKPRSCAMKWGGVD